MNTLTGVLVGGASVGCVYALLAAAYALIFKASHTLNLALGGLLLIGGYTAFQFGPGGNGLPFWVATLIAVVVVGVVGWLVQLGVARPLIAARPDALIIATVGIDLAIRAALGVRDTWALNRAEVGSPWTSPVRIAGASVAVSDLWIVGITVVLLGALGAAVVGTRWGLTMRACAADLEAARAQGISTTRNLTIVWVIAAVLAGVAGVLVGTYPRTLDLSNFTWALRALPAVVIGGMGSLRGAIVGGLIVGYAEALMAAFQPAALGGNFQLVFPFVVMFAVLLLRPQGLFGRPEVARI
ncbi:MAG: branched-chain amino acid ABC transporter permease [Geodermatophilaceae bacterium]